MNTDLAQKAVSAAICGKWEEALEFNRQILKLDKFDCDALNRLARAYAELGNIPQAKNIAQKVLRVDPHNKIAKKCFEKWKDLKKLDSRSTGVTPGDSFIEEPGKTKLVPLLNTGAHATLAKLDAGDEVEINPHGHRIAISTKDGRYIGRLPDDISSKIKNLLKMGKKYQILIKSVEEKNVKVFIRETSSAKKAADIPSFSSERIGHLASTHPDTAEEN